MCECVYVYMTRCLLDDDRERRIKKDAEEEEGEMLNKSQPLGNKVKAGKMCVCLFVYL